MNPTLARPARPARCVWRVSRLVTANIREDSRGGLTRAR
jgi:hypothetical protein